MPRACSVCTHADRKAIDRDLVAGAAPLRDIASRFGTTPASLSRHQRGCIAAVLAKAADARAKAEAAAVEKRRAAVEAETQAAEATILEQSGTTLEQVQKLRAEATRRLAEVVDDHRGAAALIASATRLLELQGRLLGELRSGTTVEIHTSPDWQALRAVLLEALADEPAALAKVTAAMAKALDGGGR